MRSTPQSEGSFTIEALVDGDQPDPMDANNSASSSVQVAEITDLSVAMTAPTQVTRGAPVTYAIAIGNRGPNDATGVNVSIEIATGLTIASVTPPTAGTCATAASTVTCELPMVARDASATVSIATAPTAADGSFAVTAVASARGVDAVGGNDTATHTLRVNAPPQPPSGGGTGGGGGGTSSLLFLALATLLGAMRRERAYSGQWWRDLSPGMDLSARRGRSASSVASFLVLALLPE
jgi:uncharacterized repeat protein (TIGR01451 family)